jgi:hypothetical protein
MTSSFQRSHRWHGGGHCSTYLSIFRGKDFGKYDKLHGSLFKRDIRAARTARTPGGYPNLNPSRLIALCPV